ncbi:MAG: carboxymuconolactone decarboxylase family protein [Rhodospirillaceae bacterium]|nr:carboxymuconolactone decarboxylase family protein [Rhodospirillaceae bacterium]
MTPRLDYRTAAPDAVKAMRQVSAYVAQSGSTGARRSRHLLVSQINGCAYCCDLQRARDLRQAGEDVQRLDCLPAWREAPIYSARERAALGWAEALTRLEQGHAPDGDYAAARAAFSDKELADLTFAIALMNGWNRIAVGFRQGPAAAREAAA